MVRHDVYALSIAVKIGKAFIIQGISWKEIALTQLISFPFERRIVVDEVNQTDYERN